MASVTFISRFCLSTRSFENICQRCLASYAKQPSYPVLKLDSSTPLSSENREAFQQKEEAFKFALGTACAGGGDKAIERHTKRNRKMVVEDRVKELLDEDSPFLELSPLAGFMMEYGNVPRGGMLTGIGRVSGKLCMVIANDGAFKGGTSYPISVKKNLRAQEIAHQNRLPCIYIVDSGGAFLPLQADIFPDKNHGGRVFYNEAIMSAAQIPQVAVVCGSCTAGGAYIPTMADEAVIVHRAGSLFLGGPPLVKAALGEIVSTEDLGGATVNCKVSGCTDYFAEDEKSALSTCRNIVSTLNVHHQTVKGNLMSDPPLYNAEELPSLIPHEDQHKLDIYEVIARIVDRSAFHEFKQLFGPSLITGFAHLDGYLIGIVGNQGEITADAASKGAHFVTMCNERQVPLIFLQNTAPETLEKSNVMLGDQLKCQGRLMAAVSCCTIAKITVVVGNGTGPAHYLMGGKSMSPNFLFSWPNAVRCISKPEAVSQAIELDSDQQLQAAGKSETEILAARFRHKDRLAMETTAVFASSRLLDDGIILPQETRKVLSHCLDIVTAYTTPPTPAYSVIRM